MLFVILGLAFAFLLGSIPTGYLLVKAKTGKDIRTLGSGNIGSTNVGRVLGGKWGYLVLFVDILKGVGGVLGGLGLSLFAPDILYFPNFLPFAAVAGHCFSPWLGWRGGKGVATMFGSVLFLFGPWMLLPVGAYLFFAKVVKMVSLGSIAAALVLPLALALAWSGIASVTESLPFSLPITLLILWRHKENIKRLLAGTERRMGDTEAQDEG